MFLMRHNRGQSQRRDSSQVGIKPVKLGMAVISMGLSVVFCAKVTAAEPQPALAFDNIVVYERQGQNDVPYQIAENLGQPTVLYIWQDWCGACIKDLRQLNELAAEASVQVADLLVQTQPHAQLTKRRDQQTQKLKHLHTPYQTLSELGIQGVPTVIVLNRYGQIAANYPEFTLNRMPEVRQLIKDLNSPEYADYKLEQGLQQQQSNLDSYSPYDMQEQSINELEFDIYQRPELGSIALANYQPSHDLRLATPGLGISAYSAFGAEVAPNWTGLEAELVHALSLDKRLVLQLHSATIDDFNGIQVLPESDDLEQQNVHLAFQSYINDIRYSAGLSYQALSYRTDTSANVQGSYNFNDHRTTVHALAELGTGDRETAGTGSDTEIANRRHSHRIALSHRLDPSLTLAVAWENISSQGLLANPDELVQFDDRGSIGLETSQYPVSRSQHSLLAKITRDYEQFATSLGYSTAFDTWGLEQHRLFTEFSVSLDTWQYLARLSLAHQNEAVFFEDIFAGRNFQSLTSRNPNLAGFDTLGLDFEGSYQLGQNLQIWSRPTYITFGAHVSQFSFEELSDVDEYRGSPTSNTAVTAALGLRLAL